MGYRAIISEKKDKNGMAVTIRRTISLSHKLDRSTIKYLESNPEMSFSRLVRTALRDKLIKEGYYETI